MHRTFIQSRARAWVPWTFTPWMLDKGLDEKPVGLIAFALLVKVNLLGPEGRCGFLSVRCFNHRDNTVSVGQPCSALTRRNLLNARRKERVAVSCLMGIFRRVCFSADVWRFSWNYKAASTQAACCRWNVVGLQVDLAVWAMETPVAFSSTPLENCCTLPEINMRKGSRCATLVLALTPAFSTSMQRPQTLAGDAAFNDLFPACLEKEGERDTNKKSMKILTFPLKKGMWTRSSEQRQPW